MRFKTVDDPEFVADDPRCAIKGPFLKDKLRAGPNPDPEAGNWRCRNAFLCMLLDRIGGLARGNDIVIHARVRNCTGEISAASDKGQTALQVVAKQQPGACVFLGRGAHATTPPPGRALTASR